jgi:hypothetical protein
VKGEWKKLHNEDLRDLYSSPSIIRMGQVALMGEKRNAYRWESQRERDR